jgi:hypothetical protein
VIDALSDAIRALADAPPQVLADNESIVELQRQLSALEAVATRAAGAWDASQAWAAEGAKTSAAYLAARCGLPRHVAQRRIRLGRALRHLPVLEAAWLAGDVDSAAVNVMVAKRRDATAAAMARDEELLVGEAKRLTFRAFCRAMAYWEQRNDPDGTDRDGQQQEERRSFHFSQTFQDMWVGDLTLDPVRGAIVDNALRRVYDELFGDDWAEAKVRLGADPSATDLRRTPPQRRADALVELCRRAMAMPKGARKPEPLFTVLVGYETFAGRICELADRTVVAPGTLVGWLEDSWVERVVFDGPSRVIDVGAHQRVFTGATRRAVEVRDRQCFHPMCEEPAHRCQIDHKEPYAWGGLTTQDNGRVACGFHNRSRANPQGP